MERVVRDAETRAAEDKRRKEEGEERTLADSASYRGEKSITDLGDKLTADQKSELESKIADVRSALSTDDVSRIKSAREALGQAFYKISESIYRQSGSTGGSGTDSGPPQQNSPTLSGGSLQYPNQSTHRPPRSIPHLTSY